ncbi:hypothetical protein LAWASA_3511 [Lawsonibacter asaccharolyticus]|nr:hypothetical protein LAWASA_3511 [Lawsonibacter asaccharolyticus]
MLQKCENFCRAVVRLSEALAEYAGTPGSTVIRDGVIQRFEFTFELAWKSLREYMEDQGAAMDAVFSKQVFKAAYAAGLIHNEQVWLDMLASRNVTSHVYDDTQAAQVVSAIRDRYISPLTELAQFYQAD